LKLQDFTEFDNLEFLAKQIVEGFITGLHRSPFHGFSVEFAEHRLYNKGESTKHIDWKLFARTEKLFVKRYEEETNLRCQIVIDTSSSMLFPAHEKLKKSKLAFATVSSAALVYLMRRQRHAVGLSLFSDQLEMHTQAKLSKVHAGIIYTKLDQLLETKISDEKNKTNAAQMLHQIAESVHKRSLVIIFSDMFDQNKQDDVFSALQHLKHSKHEVILFHVTDKALEEDFDFHNRPYRFVDLESGEVLKINPNELRDDYRTSIKAYIKELKLKCSQYKIDFVEADINKGFKEVLLPYLLKRNNLY